MNLIYIEKENYKTLYCIKSMRLNDDTVIIEKFDLKDHAEGRLMQINNSDEYKTLSDVHIDGGTI